MPSEYVAIQEIAPILSKRVLMPSITLWNRLEGRPRTANFDRALRAEIRDALFMLTKQWQMGEFEGDDAGSPIFAKVHMEWTQLNKYKAAQHDTQPFPQDLPLETKVEQRLISFNAGGKAMSLDVRLVMGRQWQKLLRTPSLTGLKSAFIKAFGVTAPDPSSRDDALSAAHAQSWQSFSAAAGRAMDGGALYLHLKKNPANRTYDTLDLPAPLTNAQKSELDALGEKFIAWFERLFIQPEAAENDAWLPERLEYQFACSAPYKGGEKAFVAQEYYDGHLDWYNFNFDQASKGLGGVEGTTQYLEAAITTSFFPVPVQFDGMPNTRWWTFEEGKTNFGGITPDTTDIGKLMLMEFGLVYANDWFLVPFTLPAGTIANVRGMAVTNVFGERTWVEPAGAGSDASWQRWDMFSLNIAGNDAAKADTSLLLLPTTPKMQDGKPLEEVYLIRDEMANMVWGIETTVPLPNGEGKPGREAAIELRRYYERLVAAAGPVSSVPAIANDATIKYQLMTSVPENWIPFIPVHVPGDTRQIQLQRASMPRVLEGDSHALEKVKPRTNLLRYGLEQVPASGYFVHEEEVPRAGICVTQCFRRTRWDNGKVYNWLGVQKQTGRGEKSSGLAFDLIVPVAENKASST